MYKFLTTAFSLCALVLIVPSAIGQIALTATVTNPPGFVLHNFGPPMFMPAMVGASSEHRPKYTNNTGVRQMTARFIGHCFLWHDAHDEGGGGFSARATNSQIFFAVMDMVPGALWDPGDKYLDIDPVGPFFVGTYETVASTDMTVTIQVANADHDLFDSVTQYWMWEVASQN